MSVTLADVARHAGVSKSTVSNVIRDAGPVAVVTRRRVLESIADLGYRPHAVARSLKQRATRTLGLVVPDAANPFFALVGRGIEARASEEGFAVVIANTDGDGDAEAKHCRAFAERRVDGVLFAGLADPDRALPELLDRDTPVVLVSCDADDDRLGIVDIDDEAAMENVARHLHDLGHRRISFAEQRLWDSTADRRPQCLQSSLRRRGLELVPPGGQVTAVAAANDQTAIELIDRLERSGRRVPDDVSVVGFDDIPLAGHKRIGLTTVRQDGQALGRRGAELLLAAIADGRHAGRRETARTELIVRSSTAPPARSEGA